MKFGIKPKCKRIKCFKYLYLLLFIYLLFYLLLFLKCFKYLYFIKNYFIYLLLLFFVEIMYYIFNSCLVGVLRNRTKFYIFMYISWDYEYVSRDTDRKPFEP